MIHAARQGFRKKILESPDIRECAKGKVPGGGN
jgi:hypothetical protein